MKLYQITKQSLKAIMRNKGRSFLTTLGIVIGIGSVIALVSLASGVGASITTRISGLGSTNLTVLSGSPPTFGPPTNNTQSQQNGSAGNSNNRFAQAASTLTPTDLVALQDTTKHPKIKAVSGDILSSALFKVGSGERRFNIVGVSNDYFAMHHLSAASGAAFNSANVSQQSKVVVLGKQFALDVMGSEQVVGQTLKINDNDFVIVGVLKQIDESSFTNYNVQAYIPNTTAQSAFKIENFSSITVQAVQDSDVDALKQDTQTTLLASHGITDANLADFYINTPKDVINQVNGITTILQSLLGGIAAISLLVGGIGIMNIMLVSVTERTREIGLRKAVGAKTEDILGQFIIESILLTLVGGLLGIGLGYLLGKGVGQILDIQPIVTPGAILLAVGVSSAVGIIFGIYPAAKAARLNPIDALRYE